MGLGVGINCEMCDRQLCYGDDTEEIAKCTRIEEDGAQTIIARPVLCHDCEVALARLQKVCGLTREDIVRATEVRKLITSGPLEI